MVCTCGLAANMTGGGAICLHAQVIQRYGREVAEKRRIQCGVETSETAAATPSSLPLLPSIPVIHVEMNSNYYILNIFSVLLDEFDTAPAIVTQRRATLQLQCQRHKQNCAHTAAVKETFDMREEEMEEGTEFDFDQHNSPSDNTPALSSLPIPVPTIFARAGDHRYQSAEPDSLPFLLFEPFCLTPSCHSLAPSVSSGVNVIVYTSRKAVRHQVARWRCSCGTENNYDGLHHHLFYYSSDLLFTHELLNDFTYRFCRSHTTFSSFWFSVSAQYRASAELPIATSCSSSSSSSLPSDSLDPSSASSSSSSSSSSYIPFVSGPTLVSAWFRFTRLQRWRYDFACPACGRYPRVVLADGLTLSLPRKYLSKVSPPTQVTATSPVAPRKPLTNQVRFLDSIVIARLVHKHAGWLWKRDGSKAMALKDVEYEQMLVALRKNGEKELAEACEMLTVLRSSPAHAEHTRWSARLIRILVSAEPLVCFLPPVAAPTLWEVLLLKLEEYESTKQQPRQPTNQQAQLLARYCPFVQQFLLFFATQRIRVPLPVIHLLRRACLQVLKQWPQQQQQRQEQQQGDLPQKRASEKSGSFYGIPALRQRPHYVGLDGLDMGKGGECSKNFSSFSRVSGGCMVLWCPHRIALGFHVIPSAEGRNDVFSAVFSHWPSAPDVIVYDFACQLQPYCLAREPEFFKNTTFVIDRLHSKNHTTCSEAFDLESFRLSGDPTFFINDSAQEQGNKGLQAIRISCLYMKLDRFVHFVRLHLETANCRRLEKLNM